MDIGEIGIGKKYLYAGEDPDDPKRSLREEVEVLAKKADCSTAPGSYRDSEPVDPPADERKGWCCVKVRFLKRQEEHDVYAMCLHPLSEDSSEA